MDSEDLSPAPDAESRALTTATTAPNDCAPAKNAVAGSSRDTSEAGAECNRRLSLPSGWPLVSPSAVKLFITLGSIAPYGQATAAELALASGLSERTIRGAFAELAALQLLGFKARPGEGMTWQLRQDDGVLSPTGTAFYQAKISKVEDSLARRELKVLEAKQAIQDAATGEERNKLRSLAEEAVARVAGRNDDGTESAHAENE